MKITNKLKGELFYNNGNIKTVYLKVIESFNDDGTGRPKRWLSRRNLEDLTTETAWLLNSLKLKYKAGNDSARGGKEGDYFKISKRGLVKVKSLLEVNK